MGVQFVQNAQNLPNEGLEIEDDRRGGVVRVRGSGENEGHNPTAISRGVERLVPMIRRYYQGPLAGT